MGIKGDPIALISHGYTLFLWVRKSLGPLYPRAGVADRKVKSPFLFSSVIQTLTTHFYKFPSRAMMTDTVIFLSLQPIRPIPLVVAL